MLKIMASRSFLFKKIKNKGLVIHYGEGVGRELATKQGGGLQKFKP